MGKELIATYTFLRDPETGLWVIEGRWSDGQVIQDWMGDALWAFESIAQGLEFFKALMVVTEEYRGSHTRFLDLSAVGA